MAIELRKYEDAFWEEFVDLINRQWSLNHPITQKSLFDWQFNGFGNNDGEIQSYTLFDNGKMIGFRGVIPGIYQVPIHKDEFTLIKGGSLSMWIVDEKYRGQKLGLKLHFAIQEMLDVIVGAGSTFNTSVPIYLKNRFKMLDSMNRYILPLEFDGYSQLLCESVNVNSIKKWFNIPGNNAIEYPILEPNCYDYEKLWTNVTSTNNIFSLYRSQEFLKWRYVDNIGFDYLFFGDPVSDGLIVARIENVESDLETHNGLKVFRIIEIIPKHDIIWQGKTNRETESFILRVLGYAKSMDCVAVDFFHSSNVFNELLESCGFRKQQIIEVDNNRVLSHSSKELKLAAIFAPFRKYAEPINALYRVFNRNNNSLLNINFDNTYLVKSENDMDRPNKINLKS
jgi:hypothetical protein